MYASIDIVVKKNYAVHPLVSLNTLNPASVSVHELKLKLGAPVILLRNLRAPKFVQRDSITRGLSQKNAIEAVIMPGCEEGNTAFIPRIPLSLSFFI